MRGNFQSLTSTRHARSAHRAVLGDRAGVSGAAIAAIEQVLSPAAVDQTLQAAAA
jgi:hypothetical protein